MLERNALADLREIVSNFPVAMLVGPRQVGKSTLAKQIQSHLSIPAHYLDLEKPGDLALLKRDAHNYLEAHRHECVVIDEVQILPELFSVLRPLVDEHRVPGRFILLGSANPEMVKGASESLAGRVIQLEVTPLGITELYSYEISQTKHWLRGGFPEALLLESDRLWQRWTDSFVKTYIQRDLNFLFSINLDSSVTERIWYMLAHNHAQLENAEALGRSLGITGTTVKKYLHFLEGAYLIRRLMPWHSNTGKRLVKSPKTYLRDSGILHHLLNIRSQEELLRHPTAGGSWEGYVIEQIIRAKGESISCYFYRTHHGAEADLVLTQGVHPIATIEIKLNNTPVLTRGFYETVKDLNTTENYIITPSSESYQYDAHIKVCSLRHFLQQILPNL